MIHTFSIIGFRLPNRELRLICQVIGGGMETPGDVPDLPKIENLKQQVPLDSPQAATNKASSTINDAEKKSRNAQLTVEQIQSRAQELLARVNTKK